jgi:regulator of ribonuclease activity A
VRDAELLAALPLAVLAIGTTPRRASLAGKGERDVVLAFGGIELRPGDRLWLDADGVVVSAA